MYRRRERGGGGGKAQGPRGPGSLLERLYRYVGCTERQSSGHGRVVQVPVPRDVGRTVYRTTRVGGGRRGEGTGATWLVHLLV